MLGDCYFLGVLASAAENPDRIKELFEEDSGEGKGKYVANITNNGAKDRVVVDDYFPC